MARVGTQILMMRVRVRDDMHLVEEKLALFNAGEAVLQAALPARSDFTSGPLSAMPAS